VLVDVNLLLYASDRRSPHHAKASDWLVGVLDGSRQVGIPWSSLAGFLRISTNGRASPTPLSAEAAWRFVDAVLTHAAVWIPAPTSRHADVFRGLMERHHATGNLVPDVELAALAYEHGLTLYSADHDFARFTEIRWVDPLA